MSRDCSWLQYMDFSLLWFSCCWARSLGTQASVAVVQGLSCATKCGIFPNPELPALAGRFFSTTPPGKSCYFFICCCCFIPQARICTTMLNNIGESEQFCLVLGLKKKAFGLLPLIMILAARVFCLFFFCRCSLSDEGISFHFSGSQPGVGFYLIRMFTDVWRYFLVMQLNRVVLLAPKYTVMHNYSLPQQMIIWSKMSGSHSK